MRDQQLMGVNAIDGDDALLSVDGLSVSYGGAVQALNRVSVVVPRGSVVAVLGGNGAGKTTLLRAISGTLSAHRGAVQTGDIRVSGRSVLGRDPAEIVGAGVVQVPEGRRIFADLTVEENLRVGGFTADAAMRREARERVYDLFGILADRRNQRAGLLSGGQQQMLAMGRALMANPRLLLLDEPSLGLAPQLVQQVGEIVRTINTQGTSVLLIEQNAAMGLDVAHQAIVLETGTVTAAGSSAELAATQEVRDRYLGVGADVRADGASSIPASTAVVDLPQRNPRQLAVDAVTVRFGGITAMDDVSFAVDPGSVHALIGPNGAGKSTCINVLSGVHRPSDGRVMYGDREISELPPHGVVDLGLSRTFQNLSLSATMTVEESLLVGRHHLMSSGFLASGLRLPSARAEERHHRRAVAMIADLLGLGDRLGTLIGTLPYGDRKRVELARALCAEPEVLLLDEPVAGMNHEESQRMASTILTVRQALGLSVLVVEHDMGFVMGIADRVTVLDFGRRIADGTPDEVRSDPAVIEAYLGTPA